MRQRLWAVFLLTVVLAVISCGNDTPEAGAGDPSIDRDGPRNTLLVFAAASLTDAFAEIESAFEAANPGVDVELSLAGSSALREQILEGAPADVFASANESNMARVVEAGEVRQQPEIFARNRLQIAVPAGNPGNVTGLSDFADPDLLIGLCTEGVPCGDLARQVLLNAAVEAAIDTNEPDVRALLTRVGSDELDAGIVYETDVMAAGDLVEGIDIPTEDNVEAAYPIAQLAGGPNPLGAADFVAFVLSDDGQDILASLGFAAP